MFKEFDKAWILVIEKGCEQNLSIASWNPFFYIKIEKILIFRIVWCAKVVKTEKHNKLKTTNLLMNRLCMVSSKRLVLGIISCGLLYNIWKKEELCQMVVVQRILLHYFSHGFSIFLCPHFQIEHPNVTNCRSHDLCQIEVVSMCSYPFH